MRRLKSFVLAVGFSVFAVAPLLAVAAPQPVSAATPAAAPINCEPRFLGIPPWYRGMTVVKTDKTTNIAQCHIVGPSDTKDGINNFVIKLILNITEIALVAIGYIAFFFIMYGGFQFLTGGSNPGQIEKARKTLLNAVIGLGISFGAVTIINLVFGVLG